MTKKRILLFGDSWGIPEVVERLPVENICGIVSAAIRPQYYSHLKSIAASLKANLIVQPRRQDDAYESFIAQVRKAVPDLILVDSYSMLLPSEILSIPRLGCINIHSALLPKYRGSNPLQWAIINNETEAGVTMHYMTGDFDAGDIIGQRRVPILIDDTWVTLRDRVAVVTRELLREQIPLILAETNTRTPQVEAEAVSMPRRKPEDGAIDWSQSALNIHNLIRALVAPLPGAFYYSEGTKIVIDKYLSLAEVTELKASQTATDQTEN